MVKKVRNIFVSFYGEDLTEVLIKETKDEYESLIPQIPYIGGKKPHTQFLIASAWYLAIYRVLKAHGETVEDAGGLIYMITEEYLNSMPWLLRRFLGKVNFSRSFIQKLKKRAEESQKCEYPADFVYRFVEGEGEKFDYGVDYLQCAVCKFLEKQDASELAPYICPVDIIYSEALGWGLNRTKTLAEGYDRCDFRFKKGGKTRVTLPEGFKIRR